MSTLIFVYGTLLRGLERAHVLEHADFLGSAIAPGHVHDLGPYPGLLEGQGTVFGELYRVDEETRTQLDRIEGFNLANQDQSLYRRRPIRAQRIATGETLTADTYFYNQDVPAASQISHGDYRRQRLETSIETAWVIAYGSNICSARLIERVGDLQEVRAGYLHHVRLTFNKRAYNGGVYANLAIGSHEDHCPAVAYRLTFEQILALDTYEGTPSHYLRTVMPFQCRSSGTSSLGFVYLANPKKLVDETAPAKDYLSHLHCGYAEHGFETCISVSNYEHCIAAHID